MKAKMSTTLPVSKNVGAIDATLFDKPVAPVEEKVRAFAREVAKRHRAQRDDARLVSALRGYYAMWSLFEQLPRLDDRLIAIAVAEYRGGRHAAPAVAA